MTDNLALVSLKGFGALTEVGSLAVSGEALLASLDGLANLRFVYGNAAIKYVT